MERRTRLLIVAAVAAIVILPGVVVAGQVVSNGTKFKTEQVIEGHNVFTVVQAMTNKNITGVTVLVREKVVSGGKLWFNDQYLISPQQAMSSANANLTDCAYEPDGSYACNRYPCGGFVMVVPAGTPRFRTPEERGGTLTPVIDAAGRPSPFNSPEWTANWQEQYFITDPNDHTFVVDKYQISYSYNQYDKIEDFPNGPAQGTQTAYTIGSTVAWFVNILGSPDFTSDDGVSNCGAYIDNPPAGYNQPALIDGQLVCYDGNVEGPDGCTYDAYAHNTSYPRPSPEDGVVYHNYRRYNAEVVMFMNDLPGRTTNGATHNLSSTRATNGCDSNTYQRNADGTSTSVKSEWTCFDDNDNAEGFSHPFNPFLPDPSDPDYDAEHKHDTALIDIWYYPRYRPHNPSPTDRAARSWAIYDTEGSTAPFDYRHGP
ncbi:MAG TPA: hypothetical protein VM889_09960 [Candidatus Thermoplasmatota archaeon]|nr:hypothetical protein [Candidatus Thermoplasmatota archaeon]